jgi:hypothetical protein
MARLLACIALALSACNGDDDADAAVTPSDGGCEVLTAAPLDCVPAFEPADFESLHDNVIVRRCGASDMGCHGSESPSGLVLTDREGAYDALLGLGGDRVYVQPGHPECSELVYRVQATDPRVRMPLNSPDPLDDAQICAIRHWIADGAEGP